MEAIIQQFVISSAEQKCLVQAVNDIDRRYLRDGLTKEDIPGILGILIAQAQKLKKMSGPDKKKLVIDILNHLISKIDAGDEDTEFELLLKRMVPPTIDAIALAAKAKKAMCPCLSA